MLHRRPRMPYDAHCRAYTTVFFSFSFGPRERALTLKEVGVFVHGEIGLVDFQIPFAIHALALPKLKCGLRHNVSE